MHTHATKTEAAGLSILSNFGLIVLELAVGLWIGSAAVISEALHCSSDLLASLFAYFSVRISSEPEDSDHQYGHGKFEDLAALFEALLMFVAAAFAMNEAYEGFIGEQHVVHPEIGMAVMVVSIIVNYTVSSFLFKKADEFDSAALHADAWHLWSDVLSSIAVFGGLGLVWATGMTIFDPLVAAGVGIYIAWIAFSIAKHSIQNLMDEALPQDELDKIQSVLSSFSDLDYHDLRTRKAGAERHIDFHLVLDPQTSLGKAHEMCTEIETAIKSKFVHAKVLIHVEPHIHATCLPGK